MRMRIATTACAVLCLALSGVAAQADVTRTQGDGSFVLANMAPPEPEPPAVTPPNAAPEGTAPAEATPTDPAAAPATDPAAAPAEGTAPAEATPAAAEVTTEATAADAAAETPPASGGTPWLWIAVGVAIAGALGFGLWRRSAGG